MKRTNKIIRWLLCFLCLFNGVALATVDNNVFLKLQDAPLRTALQMLSEQAQIDFVYGDDLVDNMTVSCDFENVPYNKRILMLI